MQLQCLILKILRRTSFAWLLFFAVSLCLQAQTHAPNPPHACPGVGLNQPDTGSALHGFWEGSRMDREPVLFVQQENGQAATGHLLFTPTKLVSVTSGDGLRVFQEGVDFIWSPGTNLLTLTPNSLIPFRTSAELHPPKGSPRTHGETIDGKSSLFFAEGGAVFQSLQVNVTYDHADQWNGYVPASASNELRTTISKLREKKPLKIVILGDSISHGACASGTFCGLPYQPPFTGLVAEALETEYGSAISLKNLSVGGMVSKWGVTMAPEVASEKPDLVIVAFGMNDASWRIPSAVYRQNIRTIVDTIKRSDPEADFILVATMTGNPEWSKPDPNLYREYRDDLSAVTGPGVAVADMTTIWQDMLKKKKFDDLTGNGINHPNDFGHRVYAQVILKLLQ